VRDGGWCFSHHHCCGFQWPWLVIGFCWFWF
jgi:hypothetical protein